MISEENSDSVVIDKFVRYFSEYINPTINISKDGKAIFQFCGRGTKHLDENQITFDKLREMIPVFTRILNNLEESADTTTIYIASEVPWLRNKLKSEQLPLKADIDYFDKNIRELIYAGFSSDKRAFTIDEECFLKYSDILFPVVTNVSGYFFSLAKKAYNNYCNDNDITPFDDKGKIPSQNLGLLYVSLKSTADEILKEKIRTLVILPFEYVSQKAESLDDSNLLEYNIENSRKLINYEIGVCSVDILEGDSICDVFINFGKGKESISTSCETAPILRWAFDELPNELDSAQIDTVEEYDTLYYKLSLQECNNQKVIDSSQTHVVDPNGSLTAKIHELKSFIMRLFISSVKQ